MTLELVSVSVHRGSTVACADVSLVVRRGETLALLGPSGSGKTSLLRAIAGLEPLMAGHIRFDSDDLNDVPPNRREFGVMFQDLALFPHRDVVGNVVYALERHRVAKSVREQRVRLLLAQLGLEGKETRSMRELSGGERQRVALARSLAIEPRLLLLDEPLGALDRQLRERLADDLRTMLRHTGLPAIVVTHDHDEAFALADRVALMRGGRIVQTGRPAEVWNAPVDEWVSDFVGNPTAIDAVVRNRVISTPWGTVEIDRAHPDGSVRLVVPTSAVTIDANGSWRGEAISVRPQRDRVRVEIAGEGEARLVVFSDEPVSEGSTLRLRVRAERLILFAARG
jgi:thiamine transport system ATP-binding protein